ncbi:phage tail protein [Clostridium beijerinckii]|uniref:Phage-related protein n=1 Tax=Clostridium beijerinckii TaxID=1520 RepID=A0AAX0B4S4_CLOBE|nr:phage tail protein [Clostridium beijerinckii]NRT90021.1 phage-related protein [Clostridium beijerinckii]NYC69552.1 phage-related protein [Clostridium beijerinckii]
MKKTLIWNGRVAENEGLKIISLPPIQLSTPVVNDVDIEDRDGTLTEFKKYTADTKQVEADYIGNNPLNVASWLQGSGEVIFGNIPDRYYKARINNVVPISQVIENQMYNLLIQFYCQPFGYLLEGKEPITLTSGTTLNNSKASYISLPKIIIYGTGSCAFTINNRTFNITNIVGGNITIDSDLRGVLENKGQYMTGKFPFLDIGENNVSWTGTGVTKVDIIPNWRCL